MPTLRMHGWNLFPGFLKGAMKQWKHQAVKLFKKYVSAYGKPDAIHAQSAIWAGIAAQAIAAEHGIPYLITEHRDNFLHETLLPGNVWLNEAVVAIFDYADQVIAVSHSLQKGVAKYMRYPKKRGACRSQFHRYGFLCSYRVEKVRSESLYLLGDCAFIQKQKYRYSLGCFSCSIKG